jgi:Caspase domain
MKKALIIGIDYYQNHNSLFGCVNDAYKVQSVLERHSDGTRNFGVKLEVATSKDSSIQKRDLKHLIQELFKGDSEIALLYFSGHGHIESTGGYLVTSECIDGDQGMPMSELLTIANDSKAKNKIIILDCCHSGSMGVSSDTSGKTVLSEGITILTASSATQYATEVNGSGVFTSLLVDALNGGAANLLGDITPGSIYAHIDKSLGEWGQRPIFKTNVQTFITLRKTQESISLKDLKELPNLFPNKEELNLDSTYEPTSENADKDNCEKFAILQRFNRVNLAIPVGAIHMYYAAIQNKSCKLTALGEHYWDLVEKGLI